MLKSLYPKIAWNEIKIVGLDMDGTLYDEIDFISQVYRPIAAELAAFDNRTAEDIYSWMLTRWVEKGSSYSHIYEEVLSGENMDGKDNSILVSACLDIFRSYSPKLVLSEFVETVLNELVRNFKIFLVTDGTYELQKKKIDSLGLDRWIDQANIGISGRYGAEFSKPSTKIIDKISIFKDKGYDQRVVYFGDRDVDALFSKNAGFEFVRVNCMNQIN